MAKFICKECKYRFESSRAQEICPYCNHRSVEAEQSAENLVDNLE